MNKIKKLTIILTFFLLFVISFIAIHNTDNVVNFLNLHATQTGTETTFLFQIDMATLYIFSMWSLIIVNIIYFVFVVELIILSDNNESR